MKPLPRAESVGSLKYNHNYILMIIIFSTKEERKGGRERGKEVGN